MRGRSELWQECFGYWQNRFIHHNVLMLGHIAWIGYINEGRGMVVCHVADFVSPSIDWSIAQVSYSRAFVSQALAADYLGMLELEEADIAAVLNAISAYDPTQAIVALVIGNGEVDINLLQDLAMTPVDCYQQVQRRWPEFQSNCTTESRFL